MPDVCCTCRKQIKKGEPFILEGKYPSGVSKWFKPTMARYVLLSWYGKIYHKKCYKK